MTIRVTQTGTIELTGRCGVEEAEVLQRHLLAGPGSPVEWTDCEYLHAAVVQVLLAGEPRLQGAPKDGFLSAHIAPLLMGRRK